MHLVVFVFGLLVLPALGEKGSGYIFPKSKSRYQIDPQSYYWNPPQPLRDEDSTGNKKYGSYPSVSKYYSPTMGYQIPYSKYPTMPDYSDNPSDYHYLPNYQYQNSKTYPEYADIPSDKFLDKELFGSVIKTNKQLYECVFPK